MIVLGLALIFLLLAPAHGAPAAPPTYAVWPALENWQPTTVSSVVQTHDGYLWVGTYHGLLRFDGVRFATFDANNAPGLPNGIVTSLFEDREGVLWIGHETGEVSRMANGEFAMAHFPGAWPHGTVEAISADEQGDVWFLNVYGFLYRLRDGLKLEVPGGATPTQKASLTRDRNWKLWSCAGGVVARLEQGVWVKETFGDTNGTTFVEKVLPARDGGMWLVSGGRLRKWVRGSIAAEPEGGPSDPGAVTVMAETRSGSVLAGTLNDGLYLLTPGAKPQHITRTDGLSHNWVRAIREDHEGNLWIGTGDGLDVLRPRKVRMLKAPDQWRGSVVRSFQVLPDGSAWIGTEGSGIYHYKGDEWKTYRDAEGLGNSYVWSLLQTSSGQLLAGTWGGGIFTLKDDRFVPAPEFAAIVTIAPALYEGRDGDIWVGTPTGIHRFKNGQLAWSAGEDKLALPDVRAITESPDGTLWFGMSGGGLGALKDGKLKQIRKTDGLISDFVLGLHASSDGALWIATRDDGLCRWKQGRFSAISTPVLKICHIVDDGEGHFWLSTLNGLLRAGRADLERCADGLTKEVRWLNYGKAEGMASLSCSGGFAPGACRTKDGKLWFPTAKGLAILDPAIVTTNAVEPPVIIEEFLVETNRQDLHPRPVASAPSRPGDAGAAREPELQVAAGQQRFEFRYTALSFTAPEKVLFKSKLEPLEKQWSDEGTKRFAQYSYLPPGHYKFHIKACNNDDVWNERGAVLAFQVLPLFYQTWWFISGTIVAGAGVIAAGAHQISRRRLRRKLEQLERQQAIERERTRIARDIHDDLGASLTRITMLSQSAQSELGRESPAADDVNKIYGTARELTRAMDEIVWAVNPKHDTLDSLVTYLGRFAQHFLSSAGIRCRLDVPLHLQAWTLTAEIRHNVFLAFKEALNNVVKHAQATEVRISLDLQAHGFVLIVADNGRGFDFQGVRNRGAGGADGLRAAGGNGLTNMQRRLEELGGHCEWETAMQEGTRVKLTVRKTGPQL